MIRTLIATFLVMSIGIQVHAEPQLSLDMERKGPVTSAGADTEIRRPELKFPTEASSTRETKTLTTETVRIAPRQGYIDFMSHEGGVDMLNEGLKGKVTLYMTGVAMTEPAVLAGLQSANEYSNQQLHRSVQTYNLVAEAAKNSGTTTSAEYLAYLSQCITKKAEDGQNDVSLLVDLCLGANDPTASTADATTQDRASTGLSLVNLAGLME